MTDEVAKYFCNICPFQTRTKGYLKMHVENKHKIYACQQCDFKSKGRLEVKKHTTSVHKEVREGIRYVCKKCDFTACAKSTLKSHTKSAHEGIKFKCNICNLNLQSEKGLLRHVVVVHNKIPI